MRKILAVLAANLILILAGTSQLEAASMADDVDTVNAKPLNKIFTLFVVRAITNERILPRSKAVPGEISDTLSVVATPGEYEPASFVIRANENIESLALTVSDLKTQRGRTIPSSHVDIKLVKAWYQDQGLGYQQETPAHTYNPMVLTYRNEPKKYKKVLVPELLLNDDSLIKVDIQKKHNYLKISDKGKEEYVLISGEKQGEGVAGAPAVPSADSANLLPVKIDKDTNKQFWVTVRVPDNAPAGIYTGRIEFKTGEESLGTMKLVLRVLPFRLAAPYEISSMYYDLPSRKIYGDKLPEQFRVEMKNMVAHGVVNPVLPGSIDRLAEFLGIRKEVGMNSSVLFYTGLNTGNPTSPEQLKSLEDKVRKAVEIAKAHGIEEVYVYGVDEALCLRKHLGHKTPEDPIKRFTSQRPAWEKVHEAGAKVFSAGVQANYYSDERKGGDFRFMGDIQDLLIAHGYPDKQEAANWHGKGHKIACYANPQAGVEQPDTYRRNFGLLLWQSDYDGAMTYIYHWEWGDFYRKSYKQHNMVYATIDGVIDTIQWEGYREGVDDVRYLNTLVEMIAKAEGDDDKKAAVQDARRYLKRLKENDINKARSDLTVIRSEIINHIIKLNGHAEPPTARVQRDGSRFMLTNARVQRIIETSPFLYTVALGNKMTSPPRGKEIKSRGFRLALDDGTLQLTAKDFTVGSPQSAQNDAAVELRIPLACKRHGVEVLVTYSLGHGDFYLRKQLDISPGEHLLRWVDVESFRLPSAELKRFDQKPMPFRMEPWDIAVGRPLFAGDEFFLGVEHPASINSFDRQQWISLRQHPGRKGKVTTSPAVIGLCPDRPRERLSDYFAQYVDENRARPVKRTVQWIEYFNVWTDDGLCREKIAVAEKVFREHGAPLDVVLMDSGWTDPKSIMRINPKEPKRLEMMAKLVEERLGAKLGLHVITSGVKRMVDKDYLAQQGYDMIYHKSRENGAYCFADPRVLAEFRDNLVRYIKDYDIAAYKFDWGHFACDKAGHRGHLAGKQYGFEAGAENYRRVHQALREANPDIFLFNTGWYSPWWLWTYDAVFAAGADYNFGLAGPPSYSSGSLLCTWRDATIRGNIVRWSPFFPINSLMCHDPTSYWWQDWEVRSETALRPFTDYLVTAWLRGTQMAEIGNNIPGWSEAHAEAAATVLKWIKANDGVILATTRYIGGDPLAGEAYGYAHFTKDNRGIVVVRNPTIQPRGLKIRLDEHAGVWPTDKQYVIRTVYPFTKVLPQTHTYGSTFDLALASHEVRVFEVWPINALPEPMPIDCRYKIVDHRPGATTFQLSPGSENLEFFSPVEIKGGALVSGHGRRFVVKRQDDGAGADPRTNKSIKASGRMNDGAYVVSVKIPKDTRGRVSLLFTEPKIQGEMSLNGKSVPVDAPHIRLSDADGREKVNMGMSAAATHWSLFGVDLTSGEHTLRFQPAQAPKKDALVIVDVRGIASPLGTLMIEHGSITQGQRQALPQNWAWEERQISTVLYN